MKRKVSILILVLLMLACPAIIAQGTINTPELQLDKGSYISLGARPVVILQAGDMNINPKKKDTVSVTVSSSSDTEGIILKLEETGVDSGEFRAEFGVTNKKSDNTLKLLRVKNDDTITVTYIEVKPVTKKTAEFTCTAYWQAYSGTVEFSKDAYTGLNTVATVSVSDKDLNLRSSYRDTARIRIYSDTDPVGIVLTAYETGPNTGTFNAEFGFGMIKSDGSSATIKIGPSDNIYALYIDEMNENGGTDVSIKAASHFEFAEAVIKTSAGNDEGEGCMLTITIDEPDKNNPTIKDRLIAKVSSGAGNREMTIYLEETGKNTGSFRCKLFLNDEVTTANSLRVNDSDIIRIRYTDETVPQGGVAEVIKEVKWDYVGILLRTDKNSYSGYSSSARITLTNYKLNTDTEKVEKIYVKVTGLDSKGIKLELKETGYDSGEFTGTLYFGKSSRAYKGILKVVDNETITVTYTNPKDKSDIVEYSFLWSFQDGRLGLDKQKYMGNNAQVNVSLNDMDLNDNPASKESVKVVARPPGGANGINVLLEETGKNSESFKGVFYINGTGTNRPSLKLNPGDRFEIVYTDEKTTSGKSTERIQSAVWTGAYQAVLTLDKKEYSNYGNLMVITLKDPDQNRDPAVKDQVSVQIKTKSGSTNAAYKLTETSENSGVFSLSLRLVEEPGDPNTVCVGSDDRISVSFPDKEASTSVKFVKE